MTIDEFKELVLWSKANGLESLSMDEPDLRFSFKLSTVATLGLQTNTAPSTMDTKVTQPASVYEDPDLFYSAE